MRFKRLLALLLAAALALAVLVGCGSGQQSAAQALLKLLDGKYPNISIEIDPDLEADLRQAISQAEAENAGDDDAVIRAALEKLVGSTVTFRNLGDGQQGDTTFDLVFFAGTDPDKAAQAAYSQWNAIFGTLPDDGQYGTGLAMVETDNGIWMLVKAAVEKAGTVDKPDKDDDEPETQEPPEQEKGYTEVTDSNGNVTGYTVNTEDGLQNLFEDEWSDARSATIILETDQTVTDTFGDYDHPFTGTLQSAGGQKVTITLSSESGQTRPQGLFAQIGDKNNSGTVQDVDIQVTGTISGRLNVGAVAGLNYGTIQNCDVTISSDISSNGSNTGAGGVVGYIYGPSTVQGCSVEGGIITGSGYEAYAGGVVGSNSGTVTACYSTSAVSGGIGNIGDTGGVVGQNNGTVTACYSTGNVTGTSGGTAGGVVGDNGGNVNACYWSGTVSSNNGIGFPASDTNATQVTDVGDNETVTWSKALEGLNSKETGYIFGGTNMNNPTLTKKT